MKIRRGWLPLGVLLVTGGVGLVFGPQARHAHAQATATPAAADPLDIAVVDYQSLLKNHPEFEKLRQLDEQLGLLKEEKEFVPFAGQQNARAQAYKKMEAEVKKAKAEMEAEEAQIRGEMAGLSARLQGEMTSELERLKAGYDQEIKDMIRAAGPPPSARPQQAAPRPRVEMPSARESLSEHQQSLLLVRQRNLTAYKLEQERASRAEIEAERARMDQLQAQHEDQLSTQYQEEKLNLQLKLQTTQDEAEQQKIQDRLGAISEEVSTKKAARRSELEADFNRYRDKVNGDFQRKVSSYSQKLDIEVASQMKGYAPSAAPLKDDAPAPAPAAKPEPAAAQGPSKAEIAALQGKIKAKVEQAQADIKSRMSAKEAELRSQMEAKSEEAKNRLMAKQKEIQKRLEETQAKLKEIFEAKKQNLDTASKAKIEALTKQIDKLQKERDAQYDRMIADLNGVVGEVAKKRDVPMVLGQVFYNRTCPDLTDYSMVGVKQLGSH